MYNFTTRIDHFNYRNNATYQMRYAVSDEYWNPYEGPIFFYTGNEDPVEYFILNIGLLSEWAPEFGALVVFAEHRYYGESLPFGEESFKGPDYSGFLTSEQALADYADLILWLKMNLRGARRSKVVAFGGSYGGLLSTFLRMKYPHVVDAALASSAPFKMFPGLSSCETYFSAVTAAFEKSSPGCPDIISESWPILDKYGSTPEGCRILQDTFRTCLPLDPSNYTSFRDWVRNEYTYFAFANYPYASDVVGHLPAYPVKVACSLLRNKSDSSDLSVINAVAQAMNVSNSTGMVICNDVYEAVELDAWNFQVCTELVQPVCGDGVRDMFYPVEWDPPVFSLGCQERFGVTPDFTKMVETYPIPKLQTASKIFFSNGNLDPWAAYGLRAAPTKDTRYLLIKGAAHHADLLFTRQGEPPSFAAARKVEKKAIKKWIS